MSPSNSVDHNNLTTLKKWIKEGAPQVEVTGLSGAALSYFFARFLGDFERPSLIILPNRKEAERLLKELRFFIAEEEEKGGFQEGRIFEFPPYDMSPLTGLSPHSEVITKRLAALYALLSGKNPIVITSLEALFLRILPKDVLVKSLEYFEAGEEVERELLLQRLESTGHQRVSLVEERGDYSVRGGVIDIFSTLYPLPVRLEFWGDHLESIRHFDPLSQRSQQDLRELVLLPANEIIMDKSAIKRARSMGRLPGASKEGLRFPGQEAWLNHFYPSLDTLFQYLPETGLVVLFEPLHVDSILEKLKKRFDEDVTRFRKEAAQKKAPFPEIEGIVVSVEEISRNITGRQQLAVSELDLHSEGEEAKRITFKGPFYLDTDLDVRSPGRGRVSMAPLAEKIAAWLASRSRVVLVIRTEQQAARLREILENYDIHVSTIVKGWREIPKGPGLCFCLGRLSRGFIWSDIGLYVISEDEIFGPKIGRARPKKTARERALTWSSFSQLKSGDLIVHEEHGIGRYKGLIKMEIEEKANDFVVIEYARKDRLYIPADRTSMLQKYIGADGSDPKLDQLGGRSWNIVKRRAEKSVRAIAKQLLQLYALRGYRKGHAFSPPDPYFREFEATFEHEETDDQIKAIEDVLEDMMSDRPMDRLICGDVGFGKTEVAIRAAFKAVSDGKQVAVLVPTTVLAEQHYETFNKRMAPYSIGVGVLSRFKTSKEQWEVLGRLRSGKVDVLIGTHRILQKDVKFSNLGLLIVDEEQRFGVKQKEALKKFRAMVDVLAITATPIPRTLHMSMMGIRDLSIIETPPEDRLAIHSYLSPYDKALIIRAIQFEMERGGQVFFVHNRVRTIDNMADRLRRLVPQARFAVAHGQLKERDLERTMMEFLKNEVDVLVCSTIIESGLDIPSANTIIINEVDRLGLAQIYQLRGRVGRSNEKAYAYLLLSPQASLTKDAEKRLKALMDFSHLGAGLHLAMHDLKIRGGGNILGFVQSGQISAIGYELYMKLIERATAELKGEEWHDDMDPEINADITAFLPEEYVIDTDVRLNLYRRLSGLREKVELEAMKEEIKDRFGPPPPQVNNLIGLMSVRLLLKKMHVSRLDVGKSALILTFAQDRVVDAERLLRHIKKEPHRFQFMAENKLRIRMPRDFSPKALPLIEQAIAALNVER